MLSRVDQRGFTIVELLIGMTILAIAARPRRPGDGHLSAELQARRRRVELLLRRPGGAHRSDPPQHPDQFVLTDTPCRRAGIANDRVWPVANGRNWVVRRAAVRLPAPFVPDRREVVERRRRQRRRAERSSSRCARRRRFRRHDPVQRLRRHGRQPDLPIDISNPAAGACAPGGPVRCRRITVSPGGQITACDPGSRPSGDSRACLNPIAHAAASGRLLPDRGDGRDADLRARHPRPRRHGRNRGGVAVRRAVPHRGEQPSPTRSPARSPSTSTGLPATAADARRRPRRASLLTFAHHPAGGNCVFGGAADCRMSASPALADIAPATRSRRPGLPGATTANQQILVDGAGDVQPGRDHACAGGPRTTTRCAGTRW